MCMVNAKLQPRGSLRRLEVFVIRFYSLSYTLAGMIFSNHAINLHRRVI